MIDRRLDVRHLPPPDHDAARGFWDGARAGELRIPRCAACGRLVWYPAATCPACSGGEHPWTRVSGRGRIFTWVRVHRAFLPGYGDHVPYVTALVELEEDARVRLAAWLRDVPASGPRIGMDVVAGFEPAGGGLVLPVFHCVG